MVVNNEQVTATQNAGMEALIGFAQTQLSALERLSALNLNVTKSAFEEGAGFAKAMLDARDTQEYLSVSTVFAQPALEKTFAYSRSVYEVGASARDRMSMLLEAQLAELNKNALICVNQFANCGSGGAGLAVAAIKSALETADAAFDGVIHNAKEAIELQKPKSVDAPVPGKDTKKKAA